MLLPLLIAVPAAYAFTVLTMRRSILTEKISRRGLHLTREYAVDPLETMFVRDAHHGRGQRLYPVVEGGEQLRGAVAASELEMALRTVVYRMAETGVTRMPVVERSD